MHKPPSDKPPADEAPRGHDAEAERRVQQQLIGKSKNISVRRMQLAGLPQVKTRLPQLGRSSDERVWKKLTPVRDWASYQLKPSDAVLLKDLELHGSPDGLRHRLAEADLEDLEHVVALAKKARGEGHPLLVNLRALQAERLKAAAATRPPAPQAPSPKTTVSSSPSKASTQPTTAAPSKLATRPMSAAPTQQTTQPTGAAPSTAAPRPAAHAPSKITAQPAAAATPRPAAASPRAMSGSSSQATRPAESGRDPLDSTIAALAARGREILQQITNDADARQWNQGVVDSCTGNDASGLMLALVEVGFEAGDYAPLLAIGRELAYVAPVDGMTLAEAFARGAGHVVAPLDASCTPRSAGKALPPRARQAYIFGAAAAQELDAANQKLLAGQPALTVEALIRALR